MPTKYRSKKAFRQHNELGAWILRRFIIAIIIFAVLGFGYIMTKSTQEDIDDRQRFANLKQNMTIFREKLQTASPQNLKWSSLSEKCKYYSGVGLQSGGWNCGVDTESSLPITSQASAIQIVEELSRAVKDSNDLIVFQSEGVYKNFPQNISGEGSLTLIFLDKQTQVTCSLTFKMPDQLQISMECSSGAHKSWYPNDEPDYSSAPDKDAWKSK